ncbi:MAG: right-handed parallel beta-helix repeat-containing protein [Gemmatimonadetes bacterium]|jgi:hypothetical protein|nr:right-handed parallel beta-helix repeat-containing protein [Gemmatimonadota bacterium]MBT6148041.1 right-handed parallel beta-helix repeat-containing protein [Gemmatimonadota bacterium]MBT7861321.1 right-handed parallel beta-helix repeat-containing protein [Gemmatimonadota bacterium]
MFNARPTLNGSPRIGTGKKACGAAAQRGRPLGGGAGYTDIARATRPPVTHLDDLLEALSGARSGDTIFIAGDATIECTERVFVEELVLELPGGVTLASDRGVGGSPGGLIRCDAFAARPLIRVTGPDARITGLRLQGPNPRRCLEHHTRSFAEGRGHDYYYKFPTSTGIQASHPRLRVDNCELAGWSHSAVQLADGDGHLVQHSFIHHNQYNGLGYGVSHSKATSLIEGNLFNSNRHSIAGSGLAGSGYEARNNVELGRTLSHCFDMHGGRDRKDGTNIAGGWMHFHHNTFRAAGRRAIVIRGASEDETLVEHNWFHHRTQKGAIRCEERVTIRNNAWGHSDPVFR